MGFRTWEECVRGAFEGNMPPWNVRLIETATEAFWSVRTDQNESGWLTVAIVPCQTRRLGLDDSIKPDPKCRTAEANTRLIVAAPDLLLQAAKALDVIEDTFPPEVDCPERIASLAENLRRMIRQQISTFPDDKHPEPLTPEEEMIRHDAEQTEAGYRGDEGGNDSDLPAG